MFGFLIDVISGPALTYSAAGVTVTSLTPHADVQWVQSCRTHFDDHLVGVVDDGETGVPSEPQNIVASILVNDPGWHDVPACAGGGERSAEPGNRWWSPETTQPPPAHQVSGRSHLRSLRSAHCLMSAPVNQQHTTEQCSKQLNQTRISSLEATSAFWL